jgi:hypothetical protein
MQLTKHEMLGKNIDELISNQPFGSPTKREFELSILKAVIDAGLCERDPVIIAKKFRLTLTKSHAYLTDIALREPLLSDADAVQKLSEWLAASEVKVSADEI